MRWLGSLAREEGARLYLVGGAVRDRLLGIDTKDIDLACEGKVRKLGEDLSRMLDSDFIYYPAFRTGTIQSPGGARIDIARTRRESYPVQGELPKVEPSSIEEDLYRRDFTVNAMAQSLNPQDFGKIIDPLNGMEDTRKGLIKVIHEKSFTDDPTRIFRAVRYSERLGFEIEPKTLRLLKSQVERISALSGERLLYELRCIAKETRETRVRIIKKLDALGAIGFLGTPSPPGLSLAALNKIDDKDSCAFLCIFLSFFDEANTNRLPLSKQCIQTVSTLRQAKKIAGSLSVLRKPSTITFYLKNFDERGLRIITLTSKKPSVAKIDRYLESFKDIKVVTSGDDIMKLGLKPGPGFKRILDELLKAKLDGLVNNKRDELKMAKKLLKER